ncbi:hypothetical protein [Bradyrhizobium sp. JYMT SZCCT0428]|uniref:hypothetical protein n=1 Tax=Bradyrhizobium sp. JYMT SZCCT0428 TaxID=2807673 RepID=UPI001BAA7F2D|nr:hypothetical protein [Bradyrhizobium sp. JYMT SZCCT0428]MBR1154823.1 hypothetical protein [Bradyrhizobium sp. JYMT SZCCT0428]
MKIQNLIETKYWDRARCFQDAFREFLAPRHDLEECGWLAVELATRYWLNHVEPVNRRHAHADLATLKECLNFISGSGLLELENVQALPYYQATAAGSPLVAGLLSLKEIMSEEAINEACSDIEAAINVTIDKRNIRWDALQAIESLRCIWWLMGNRPAPSKALNPSSKFADFLRVGFVYLDLDADPVSAFRSWSTKWPYKLDL